VAVLGLLILLLGLLLYGNLVAYRAVRAPVVVAVNLVLAAGLVAGARALGISWHALGLDPGGLETGLLWGAAAAGVTILGAALLALTPLLRGVTDLRAVRMVPREMAFHYLVRIPFGTALSEEVIFRGVLLALMGGGPAAILISSVAFGLWHIGASLDFLRANRPRAGRDAKVLAVVSGVALTTVGGIGFCVLRVIGESLLAPFLAHTVINIVGLTVTRIGDPRDPSVT
jgi:membrane protease YdiL (CAAX protease family)